MPSLGPAEILVILVVALLVFGPDKMPEIGRQLARGVRELRRIQQHVSSELRDVVSDIDPPRDAARPGGDPVPMLPPKDTALPPNGQEPRPADPGPQPDPGATGSTGGSAPSPPADPA
jgi:sec-independent protein translocase protein TatA